MITVRLDEIRALMEKALSARSIAPEAASLIIEDHVAAQLEGKVTHGLGKFLLIDSLLPNVEGPPVIVTSHGAVTVVNGQKSLGHVAAQFCIDLLPGLVSTHGIAAVGLYNFARYGRLASIASRISSIGLVGVVLNNAGPPAVAPIDSFEPICGTNPIAFAFPSADDLVIDFATSEAVWGEIRQAVLEKRTLVPGAFYDSAGHFTENPDAAYSVKAFGGHKGFALCLAIELLAGALVPAKVGVSVDSQYDLGTLFLAFDPKAFETVAHLGGAIESLKKSISTAKQLPGARSKPRIPGSRAKDLRKEWEARGEILVDDSTLRQLRAMALGDISSIKSTNLLD